MLSITFHKNPFPDNNNLFHFCYICSKVDLKSYQKLILVLFLQMSIQFYL